MYFRITRNKTKDQYVFKNLKLVRRIVSPQCPNFKTSMLKFDPLVLGSPYKIKNWPNQHFMKQRDNAIII